MQLQEAEIVRLERVAASTTPVHRDGSTKELLKTSESARNAVSKQIETQLSQI